MVIISHNLHDIFEVADRITVLRLGQRVACSSAPRRRSRRSCTRSPPARSTTCPGWPTSRRPKHDDDAMPAPGARARVDEACAGDTLVRATCSALVAGCATASSARSRSSSGSWSSSSSSAILDDTFLTERNFTNLLLQMAAIATIAIGVVFVLLIGEIDLSVAYVSAVGGVVMTLLLRPDDPGWPWWLAIGVALLLTTTIGFSRRSSSPRPACRRSS